jgi:Bacterial regulatory proteins, luxR family
VPIAALRPWASVLTWPEPNAKVPAEQVIVPVRRRDRAQADELTGQEHRVAMLMAHGATMREAATQLFLSPKTIEAHQQRRTSVGIHPMRTPAFGMRIGDYEQSVPWRREQAAPDQLVARQAEDHRTAGRLVRLTNG